MEKPLKRCFSQEASEIRGGCEVSSRRRLMFLLFCLLFRCHEGSSVNDFPLQRFSTTGPCTLKNQPYLLYGMVLYHKILRQCEQSVNRILQFGVEFLRSRSSLVVRRRSKPKNRRSAHLKIANDQRSTTKRQIVHCGACRGLRAAIRSNHLSTLGKSSMF